MDRWDGSVRLSLSFVVFVVVPLIAGPWRSSERGPRRRPACLGQLVLPSGSVGPIGLVVMTRVDGAVDTDRVAGTNAFEESHLALAHAF
jgi:hypothetical protein